MRRAELMGAHTHHTDSGHRVNVFERNGVLIARGYHEGRAFGLSLGAERREAASMLRKVLVDIDAGAFRRPSECRGRRRVTSIPALSLRQLVDDFLVEKRRLRGKSTAADYAARLAHALNFAERKTSRQRWQLAKDIDREFVVEYRTYLSQLMISRNGKPGGTLKPISVRQIQNLLEMLRTVLAWAMKANVRKLPAEFVQPVTSELIGSRPPKDPFRSADLPVESRVELIRQMNLWQFLNLSASTVLPLRFEDISGILISDIDWARMEISIGTRFGGSDHTKGHTDVRMPIPAELVSVLRACIGNRCEGPLFRSRACWSRKRIPNVEVKSRSELEELFHLRLASAPAGDIQCPKDKKDAFRSLLREMGGITEGEIGAQFRSLIGTTLNLQVKPYKLRHSITDDLKKSGVAPLELYYLTEHAVPRDIILEYAGLGPRPEMEKYFAASRALLEAIQMRAVEFGLPDHQPPLAM